MFTNYSLKLLVERDKALGRRTSRDTVTYIHIIFLRELLTHKDLSRLGNVIHSCEADSI